MLSQLCFNSHTVLQVENQTKDSIFSKNVLAFRNTYDEQCIIRILITCVLQLIKIA